MEGGSSSASYDPINEARVLDVQPLRTVTPIHPGPSVCSAPDALKSDQAQPQTTTSADETPKSNTFKGSRDSASAAAVNADTPLQPGVSSASDVAASGKKENTDLPVRIKKTARKSVALRQPESFVASSFDLNDSSDKKHRKERTPSNGSDIKRRRQSMASIGCDIKRWRQSTASDCSDNKRRRQRTPSNGSDNKRPRQRTPNKKALIISENLRTSLAADCRESVERVLMIYDGLRRRFSQKDDMDSSSLGSQPGLKAGSTMMGNGMRLNATKRAGAISGVEIGDLYFFRYEMSLVGLHTPIVAGIDYMIVKSETGQEPIATSIVSSGVYEDDDMDDSDILIYTGHGGATIPGKHIDNQKLERGNLALERSMHKGNEIRVIRGVKGIANPKDKMYIYDGLYKVQESWTEKGKAGFNVFKFKLVRVNGQPEGSAFWKRIQQWKGDPSSRPSVIMPDISTGNEKIPVCLVNDVDSEKGPARFFYAARVKYVKPINSVKPLSNCDCHNSCTPDGSRCSCKQRNRGYLPYTSNGLLVSRKQLLFECGSCQCSINCRNRVTQKGINLQFEVFKTKDRGWGLRSWDPIRAGSFICEFVGEVSDCAEFTDVEDENNYLFDGTASTTENFFEWNYITELLGEETLPYSDGSLKPLSIVINAKSMGNVSRFMNHCCSPNVFWQPVLYDQSEEHHPRIMFFALKHIPPMTELTYDYGSRGRFSQQKKCLCGSSKCRGFFH